MANQKKFQFGVLLDTQNATVVGRADEEVDTFSVLGKVAAPKTLPNSNENAANNEAKTNLGRFFKDILSLMQNAKEIYVTGPGVAQEQFINYLADTPQFKATKTINDTETNLSEGDLVSLVTQKFK